MCPMMPQPLDATMSLESYFARFKAHIIGEYQMIQTPYHRAIRILYTDWTASGRMYGPIEDRLRDQIGPLVANTHTDTNDTGSAMTYAYHQAQQIIKRHVGANSEDVLISADAGMTGVVNKLQRMLGLKIHESFKSRIEMSEEERPGEHQQRLGVISFYIDGLHHNVGVKLLNDRFGIQTRGGCSCAGTYGHYLLNVSNETSKSITDLIDRGDCSTKPGWIRLSIHPTMRDAELHYVLDAIQELAIHHSEWVKEYDICLASNSIQPNNKKAGLKLKERIDRCLELK